MSDESYEIRCPVCQSAVPSDAARCPNCAATEAAKAKARAANANVPAVSSPTLSVAAAPALDDPAADSIAVANAMEGASTLKLKDYHQMVRSNYGAVERRGGAAAFGNPLVPILLIVALGLVAAAAVALHWF